MRYYFRPDWIVLLISLLGTGLFVYLWIGAGSISSGSFWIATLFTAVFLWFFSKVPLYTYVDEDIIRVRQLLSEKNFRRSQTSVRRLTDRDMEGTIRTMGSGGLGGYIGYFNNPRLGTFYMIAVSKSNLALLTTEEGKQYVIHFPPLQ